MMASIDHQPSLTVKSPAEITASRQGSHVDYQNGELGIGGISPHSLL